MTKSIEYMGQDYPYDGKLVPAELNPYKRMQRRQLSADAATNIAIGALVYISSGTESGDATATTAELGSTDENQGLWLAVEPVGKAKLSFAHTTDAPHLPWLAPNTSITAADYQLAAEDEFVGIKLEIGMKFWARIGSDITADTVFDQTYYCGASGFPAAGADPNGTAIEKTGHAFRSMAAFTNMNWALFEYMGYKAYDDT